MSMIKKYTDEEYENSKWDGKLRLECEHCHKDFWKSTKKVKLYLRGNSKQRNLDKCQFCSLKCAGLAKSSEKKEYACKLCGKAVFRRGFEVESSGNVFCSKSCSVTTRNTGRKRTDEEKLKVSIKLFRGKIPEKKQTASRSFHPCAVCGAKREKKRKTCSKACASMQKTGEQPLLSAELAKATFDKFVLDNNRVPSQREHSLLLNFARREFKTWNKMILHFGYTPMTKNLSKKRIKCSDGHIVDSVSEKIIDEFLTSHNISHEVHKRYNDSKLISDFFLTDHNVYVEYFGLDGEFVKYDENTQRKLKLFEDNDLKVITVYPKDLFPENKLSELFKLWILS